MIRENQFLFWFIAASTTLTLAHLFGYFWFIATSWLTVVSAVIFSGVGTLPEMERDRS